MNNNLCLQVPLNLKADILQSAENKGVNSILLVAIIDNLRQSLEGLIVSIIITLCHCLNVVTGYKIRYRES